MVGGGVYIMGAVQFMGAEGVMGGGVDMSWEWYGMGGRVLWPACNTACIPTPKRFDGAVKPAAVQYKQYCKGFTPYLGPRHRH